MSHFAFGENTLHNYHIYGLGAALVDTEIEVTDHDLQELNIQKGLMTLVDEPRQNYLLKHLEGHLVAARRASGGSAANSIIAAQYFGARTFYSCKVADDENGQFYLRDLADAGVAYPDNCCVQEGITGKCLVMITDDAERTMNTFLGISAELSEQEVDELALKQSQYVYIEGYLVTSPTGLPAAQKALRLAREHGVRTALSLSDPGIVEHFYDGLASLIDGGVDLLFCNQAEALAYTRTQELSEAVERLKPLARQFAITLGAEGARVFDGNSLHSVPAPQVKAKDSNGAGDMFAGAFLYALSQGKDSVQAAHFANRAAAQVVSQFGPRLAAEQYQTLLNQA